MDIKTKSVMTLVMIAIPYSLTFQNKKRERAGGKTECSEISIDEHSLLRINVKHVHLDSMDGNSTRESLSFSTTLRRGIATARARVSGLDHEHMHELEKEADTDLDDEESTFVAKASGKWTRANLDKHMQEVAMKAEDGKEFQFQEMDLMKLEHELDEEENRRVAKASRKGTRVELDEHTQEINMEAKDGEDFKSRERELKEVEMHLDEAEGNVVARASKGVHTVYSIETGAGQSDRLKACLSTWAANLASNSLQIVGHTKLPVHELESAGARFIPTPQCPDNHNGGECKDAIALAEAYETGAEWVILVGDDNYALTRNIDEALRVFNAQEPHVIGIRGCGDCPAGGLCGGGGQIFSRGALALMLSAGRVSYLAEMGKEGSSHGYFGDVSSCRVAFSHNISIESVYGLNGWRMNKAEMESRIGSRSLKELTFHYLDPYDMYDVHSMVTRALQRPSMYEEETAQSLESGVATYMRELKLYVAAENERRHHAPGKSRKTGKMPCGWTTGP
eukprot:gnl/TRDRNA2_/TRDRNA2_175615_c0_seq2.p1 gnl/TRDRNA2_/TRDRNA2_175615_c0~~gnl/TRDRNA2_/TRDRNA2_175615_c0_seq2.p1  ORF type:complete len:508 (-),score=66.43 gnl/TRDRNA2_/TRDRNA2_175615_c0_seq2:105-1628(-)